MPVTGANQERKEKNRLQTVKGETKPVIAPEWDVEAAQFSGGLYCTAGDMARFLSLQFQEKTPGGDQIVSPDGLRMMHLDSLGWGYGWAPKHKSIHHSGGQLYVKLRQDSSFNRPIIPLGNDKFSVEGDSDPWFFFLRDDKRKISKLKFTGYTFKRNTGK